MQSKRVKAIRLLREGVILWKYRPIIVTAECGMPTRAGIIVRNTRLSLGYIISNPEAELGVKFFRRDQRGVRLTEAGTGISDFMRQFVRGKTELPAVPEPAIDKAGPMG